MNYCSFKSLLDEIEKISCNSFRNPEAHFKCSLALGMNPRDAKNTAPSDFFGGYVLNRLDA